jgi:hypothetical protein
MTLVRRVFTILNVAVMFASIGVAGVAAVVSVNVWERSPGA